MHTAWLLPTALLSTSVHAFYPIHSRKPSDDSTQQEKRFYPITPESEGSQASGSLTVDIKKVATPSKRDNTFPVVIANKPDMPNAMAIDEDGQDYSYFSTMKFGSKETPMYMLIDTGSANTWVMGTECTSSSCQVHDLFGPPDSKTLNVTQNPWTLTYGTGTVQGVVASDTVAFANYSIELGFGLATTASDDFDSYPMDGILGLGRSSSNILGTPTIMQALANGNDLASNSIGIHLQRNSDGAKDGQITFGGVDKTQFAGEISYTKALTNDGNWEIPVGDCSVDGVSANLTSKTAIIDTGTSFILMPPTDAQALHSLIPGSVADGEYFSIPCSTTSDVQVTFSSVSYSISSKDYVGKATGTGSLCTSNIIGHQAFGPNQWILGDVFLKNVYAVFDYDKESIGFGTKNGVASVASPAPTATATSAAAGSATSVVASSKTSSSAARSSSSSARASSMASPVTKSSSSSSSSSAPATTATTTHATSTGTASAASSRGMSMASSLGLLFAFLAGHLI